MAKPAAANGGRVEVSLIGSTPVGMKVVPLHLSLAYPFLDVPATIIFLELVPAPAERLAHRGELLVGKEYKDQRASQDSREKARSNFSDTVLSR
jgi:hypothetical protein